MSNYETKLKAKKELIKGLEKINKITDEITKNFQKELKKSEDK